MADEPKRSDMLISITLASWMAFIWIVAGPAAALFSSLTGMIALLLAGYEIGRRR